MQTKLYNINGEEVGKLSLSDQVFKAPYNEALIHQIIVYNDCIRIAIHHDFGCNL